MREDDDSSSFMHHRDEDTQLSQLSINTEPIAKARPVAANTYRRTAVIETFPPLVQIPRIIVVILVIGIMLVSPVFYSNNSPFHTKKQQCSIPPNTTPEIYCGVEKRSSGTATTSITTTGCIIQFNVTVTERKKTYLRKFTYDCPLTSKQPTAMDCFLTFLFDNNRDGGSFQCADAVSVRVWPRLQSDQMRTLKNVKLLFSDEMTYAAVLAAVTICFAFVIIITLQCNNMRSAHKYNTIFSRVPEAFRLDGDDPEALYIVNFDKEQYYSMKYLKAYMKRGSIHVSPKLQSISPIYKLNIHPNNTEIVERAQKMFAEHSKYYKLLSSTSIWHDETIIWMQKVHKSHGYSDIRLKAIITILLCFLLAVGAFVTTHSIIDYRSMYVLPFIALIHVIAGQFIVFLINYISELRCNMVVTDRRVILTGSSRAYWNSWIKYVRLSDLEDLTCEESSGTIQFNPTQEFISVFKKKSKMKPFKFTQVDNVKSVMNTIKELMDADAIRTEQSVTQLKFDAKEIPEVWIEDIDNYEDY